MTRIRNRVEEVLMEHARRIDTNHPGYGNCRCGFVVDLPQDQAAHVAAALLTALGLTEERIDAHFIDAVDGPVEDSDRAPRRRWVSDWEPCNRHPLPPNLKM